MSATFMKCGHTASGVLNKGPVCASCIGINPDAEVVTSPPDLTGRMARCVYCHKLRASSLDLPFFEYTRMEKGVRNMAGDSYYCGCRGWD